MCNNAGEMKHSSGGLYKVCIVIEYYNRIILCYNMGARDLYMYCMRYIAPKPKGTLCPRHSVRVYPEHHPGLLCNVLCFSRI